ncbi:MAG: cytochrome P450 [Planctomycetota bacterium]|nr:cytochrome P450 [Planctomycetota bacterium]
MGLPPGPKSPGFIQAFHWILRPIDFMEKNKKRFGDVFLIKVPPFGNLVFLSNPKHIKEVFEGDPDIFYAGQGNDLVKPFLGEFSLLVSDSAEHLKQRRLLNPPFHGQRMKVYGPLIQEITRSRMSQWEKGQSREIQGLMGEISLAVILRAVFGLEDSPRFNDFQDALNGMLSSAFSSGLLLLPLFQRRLGPLTGWSKYLEERDRVDALIFEEISTRRHQTTDKEDILSLMFRAHHEDGRELSAQEIRDQLLTLLVAGHETTATALSWALYWVHANPRVYSQLMEELGTVAKDDLASMMQLPYLNGVVKETLRIEPIVPIVARCLQDDVTLGGYDYPKGTVLSPCIYLTHQRDDIYPDPKTFKPERFIGKKYTSTEYLPFGGGVRRCIGAAFAEYEFKIALATILKEFQLELKSKKYPGVMRRSVTLAPKGGVPMTRI